MPRRDVDLVSLYDDELEIGHLPGTSGRAVVSFAGIGLKVGPIKIYEFSKSLDGTPHDIYFIRDKERRWYAGLTEKITEIINAHLRSRNIQATACLGHSMGGFGAMYLASDLHNCNRVIAFSPQSTVNSELVPWEGRWNRYRRKMPAAQGLDAPERLSPCNFLLGDCWLG